MNYDWTLWGLFILLGLVLINMLIGDPAAM